MQSRIWDLRRTNNQILGIIGMPRNTNVRNKRLSSSAPPDQTCGKYTKGPKTPHSLIKRLVHVARMDKRGSGVED